MKNKLIYKIVFSAVLAAMFVALEEGDFEEDVYKAI